MVHIVPLSITISDVPLNQGVCTDLVVRAYRKPGVDLQQLVHEDMRANFSSNPNIWDCVLPILISIIAVYLTYWSTLKDRVKS